MRRDWILAVAAALAPAAVNAGEEPYDPEPVHQWRTPEKRSSPEDLKPAEPVPLTVDGEGVRLPDKQFELPSQDATGAPPPPDEPPPPGEPASPEPPKQPAKAKKKQP